MNRLSPDRMEPACRLFLLQLSNDTHVNSYDFADWIRANLDHLRGHFLLSGEPMDQMGAWLRAQFKHATRSAA